MIGADLLAGEVDRHELGPVGQLDHHPVERLDAQIHQADGQTLGLLPRLRVGQPVSAVDERLLVRVDIGRPVEKVPEAQARSTSRRRR